MVLGPIACGHACLSSPLEELAVIVDGRYCINYLENLLRRRRLVSPE